MPRLSQRLDEFMFALTRIMATPIGIERAADSIRKRWPDIDVTEAEMDPEVLAREMDDRRKNDDWSNFYWIDVIRTAQGFFRKEELHTSKEFADLRDFLLDQIYYNGNAVYNHVMFNKYLETFARPLTLTKNLARSLSNIESWSEIEPSIDRLSSVFEIFDVDVVPERVANFMDEEDHPYIALRKVGIKAPYGAGLMQKASKIFVDKLVDRIGADYDRRSIDKLLDWIHPPDTDNPDRRNEILDRIVEQAVQAVNAILLPWHQREIGSLDFKDIIKHRLIEAISGDPRTATHGVWVRCSRKAREVIIRWLVKDTLDIFFEIISLTANERNDHARMWNDRRDIWFDLYSENRIKQAWFALSSSAAQTAIEIKRERDMDTMQFARNRSGGDDRHKCLLIMEIDNRWVVEGSYNFKTHIFPADTSIGEFKESYTCDEFRYFRGSNKPKQITHHANWSRKVLRALEQ